MNESEQQKQIDEEREQMVRGWVKPNIDEPGEEIIRDFATPDTNRKSRLVALTGELMCYEPSKISYLYVNLDKYEVHLIIDGCLVVLNLWSRPKTEKAYNEILQELTC